MSVYYLLYWEISTTISGGKAAYTYLWNTSETSTSLVAVTSRIYSVMVLDFNGCELAINIKLIPPPNLTDTATLIDSICFNRNDGFIDLAVTGGSPPYSYAWNTTLFQI